MNLYMNVYSSQLLTKYCFPALCWAIVDILESVCVHHNKLITFRYANTIYIDAADTEVGIDITSTSYGGQSRCGVLRPT
jgi:hypothetical protein